MRFSCLQHDYEGSEACPHCIAAIDSQAQLRKDRDELLEALEEHHREDRQCSVYLGDRDPAYCLTCTLIARVKAGKR